jgi:hypothetical protein
MQTGPTLIRAFLFLLLFRTSARKTSRKEWPNRQVLLWAFSSTKVREGLSGALPLHRHRHCTHVSFTAVLGMDVLPHCVSGQRPLVSNVPVKVYRDGLERLLLHQGEERIAKRVARVPDAMVDLGS